MRKLLLVLLCGSLLLSTVGCAAYQASHTAAGETPYSLYFQVRDLGQARGSDALDTEQSDLRQKDGMTAQAQAEELMRCLLDGPSDDRLESPIPSGTQLLSVTLDGAHAVVDLSAAYGSLSGVSLTVADYCIALTLTQIPDITSVSITVRGQELAYRDTQSFTEKDLLRSSTEDVVGTVEATLYFLNASGELTGEERKLELYEGDTQAATLLKALWDGPTDKSLTSALPKGLSVQSVWMEEDICYVNLPSSALKEIPSGTDLKTALRALAQSLCSLDAVTEVQFLSDGEYTGSYGGVDINQSYGGAEN